MEGAQPNSEPPDRIANLFVQIKKQFLFQGISLPKKRHSKLLFLEIPLLSSEMKYIFIKEKKNNGFLAKCMTHTEGMNNSGINI